jgi:hypothetical protein
MPLTKIEPPKWMLDLFKAIDTLDMSEDGGFSIFTDKVTLQFGPQTVHGVDNVKKFFVKIDEPFITDHKVAEVMQFDRCYLMQGSAVLRKKGDPPEKSFEAAPLINVIWLNEEGKIIRYVVDFPPELAEEHAEGLK